MSKDTSKTLLELGIQFMGRQTAIQTHEITNVHNILNELAGLLDDISISAKAGNPIDPQRTEEIAKKIKLQVKRGNSLVRGLNRFAHSVDVLSGMFDLEEVAERIKILAQRPARLGRVQLKIVPAERALSLEGFILGYQQAILTALDLLLESGGESNEVCIKYGTTDESVEITLESDTQRTRNDNFQKIEQHLNVLVTELSGSVKILPAENELKQVILSFPHVNASHNK